MALAQKNLAPKKPAKAGEPLIGLESNTRKVAASAVSKALADTYMLQLKTQYYHWNVTGPYFKSLHVLFEEQYNQLAPAVDTLAERIRALGYPAPGTYREFAELSVITEDKTLPADWQGMVKNLVAAHETLIRNLRDWAETVKDTDDEVTVSLLTDRLEEHEKTAWMLRSHLQ